MRVRKPITSPWPKVGIDSLEKEVIRQWRRHGYSASTVRGYFAWIRRHRCECKLAETNEYETLTKKHVCDLAKQFAPILGLTETRCFVPAQSALRAWSAALAAMGIKVPQWTPPSPFLDVIQYWRAQGYHPIVIRMYLVWMRRHREHYNAIRPDLLTRQESLRFVQRYAQRHSLSDSSIRIGGSAFWAWARALVALGTNVPPWVPIRSKVDCFASTFADYRKFRKQLRGTRDSSLEVECRHIRMFLQSLRRRRRKLSAIAVLDIDRFILGDACHGRAPSTVAGICTSLRSFLKFLHATNCTKADLSKDIEAPRHRRSADPPRGLPWADVRKFLRAIDQRTLVGKRDYAAFLLMASYGMGSGEVRGLCLDDIDWSEGTLRTVRAKTGVITILPLLGPVGDALVSYLRAGPPRPPSMRILFLRTIPPPAPLTAPQLRSRFHHHAKAAGIPMDVCTHAFRHSHATLQVESAAPPIVVSEILGHSNPSSLSSYARVAVEKLRAVCLPIP